MKHVNIFFFSLVFVSVCCASAKNIYSSDEASKLQGSWVSEEDSNWVLIFRGDKLIDTYGKEEAEECTFSILKESCDIDYTTLEAVFLKCLCKDEMCFEITSLTDVTLSYRETSTGKLSMFRKIK